jgi:hypothetical protein
VGNGVTDPEFDGNALVPFAFGKSLISAQLHQQAYTDCGGGSYWDARPGSDCHRTLNAVWAERESGRGSLRTWVQGQGQGREPSATE